MFTFLLILEALVAFALCAVILMQRSEGGGLGVGGSSSGFMTARGAADFLTRATSVLGGLFIVLSIVLAVLAAKSSGTGVSVESTLDRSAPVQTAPAQPVQAPPPDDPLADVVQ